MVVNLLKQYLRSVEHIGADMRSGEAFFGNSLCHAQVSNLDLKLYFLQIAFLEYVYILYLFLDKIGILHVLQLNVCEFKLGKVN